MFNDKIVYTEHALMKDRLKKSPRLTSELEELHKVIIDLNCDYVCQIDCKFGLDLLRIKKECWKTQVAGIADSYLYERYSRNLFRHQEVIDYSFSEIKNINGKDLYDLVFINDRKVNNILLQIMLDLSKKYVVIPMENVDFKLCEHDGNYDVINNILVMQKPKPKQIEVNNDE